MLGFIDGYKLKELMCNLNIGTRGAVEHKQHLILLPETMAVLKLMEHLTAEKMVGQRAATKAGPKADRRAGINRYKE